MKSKPTLQESKPVFFLFLFLSTNNECLMFLNIKKAFDSVSHIRLLKILIQYGFDDNLVSWFNEFLNNKSQKKSLTTHYQIL